MTSKTLRIVFLSILLMAFTVSAVNADWETRTVNSPYDDGIITETGGKFFASPWVSLKEPSINHNAYFAFRNIELNQSAKIENAYLQLSAPFPWNYNQSLPVTVCGLKTTGDLVSWNPPPDLNSYPGTIAFTNWDSDPLHSSVQVNITITDLVTEIYNQAGWIGGNDIAFRISSVAQPGGSRYATAYDSDPLRATKLFIEWTASNTTYSYYKGYRIENVTTTGTAQTYTWSDQTAGTWRMTTAEGTDYKTVTLDAPGDNRSALYVPDGVVSVGEDIYVLQQSINNPWELNLYKTDDRGDSWTDLGTIRSGTPHQLCAMAYDQNNTIHIQYGVGYSTYWRMFKVHNQSFTNQVLILSGLSNIGDINRAVWDEVHDTIWFTRYGGGVWGSQRRSSVMRRADSDGIWETYTRTAGDRRDSDVVWADGHMWWVLNAYSVTPASNYLQVFMLHNYSDITSWVYRNIVDESFYYISFDVGVWTPATTEYLVITVERAPSASIEEMWLNRWRNATSDCDTWNYNLTGFFPASQPQFHAPKNYYDQDGELRMGIIVQQDSGYSLIDKEWSKYQIWEQTPPTTVFKATGHQMWNTGGDPRPFSTGQTGGFRVTDENGTLVNSTCLDLATTIEEVQACLDDIVGVDPQDPNPPGSNYPPDGVGVLTRFNIRFYIWLMGWVGVFVPLFAMAYRNWSIEYYFYFAVIMIAGVGLLWSMGSI